MDKRTPMDNTVELKDLVYAPLQAIAAANTRLSSHIVEFLASTGDLDTDSSGKPVVHLRTIQMLYDQLRSDSMENTVADCIGLEIPLLSIYPLSSLKVSRTKVTFDAEIKGMQAGEDDFKILTQVCSPKQRDGANLPRFSYEVELDSVPVSEGLARFVDTLNAQAIPKLIHSKPVDGSGKKLTGKELEEYEREAALRKKENELSSRLAEVKELIRTQNNALKLDSGMDFDEYTEHLEHLRSMGEQPEVPDEYRNIEDYQEVSADLETQLDEVRRELVMSKVQEEEPPAQNSRTSSQDDRERWENRHGRPRE